MTADKEAATEPTVHPGITRVVEARPLTADELKLRAFLRQTARAYVSSSPDLREWTRQALQAPRPQA